MAKSLRHAKPVCPPYYVGRDTPQGSVVIHRDPECGTEKVIWSQQWSPDGPAPLPAWGDRLDLAEALSLVKAIARHLFLWDGFVQLDWDRAVYALLFDLPEEWTINESGFVRNCGGSI